MKVSGTSQDVLKPYVKLLALGVGPVRDVSMRLVEFLTVDNSRRRILMRSSDLADVRRIKTQLVDQEHPVVSEPGYWKSAQEALASDCADRVQLRRRPGFDSNGVYLAADGAVYGGRGLPYPPMYDPACGLRRVALDQAGNLADWQEHLALYALHSPPLMLALCSAISGCLVRFAGMGSGGFHFFGESSIGKTSLLRFASTFFGPAEFVEPWQGTDKGFEEVGLAHNDSALVLDELKLLDDDPRKAALRARKLIYQLAEGRGKQRSIDYEAEPAQWNLSVLSAGELSLGEHAADGGMARLGGETVRVVDVPAGCGGSLGIFTSLPAGFEDSGKAIDQLRRNCDQCHGVAGALFIKRLVRTVERDADEFRVRLRKRIDGFVGKAVGAQPGGQERRIAGRFGLAYAAGVSARKRGVLPFTDEQIFDGIYSCYKAALRSPAGATAEDLGRAGCKKLCRMIRKAKIPHLRPGHSHSLEELERAPCIRATVNGQQVLAIAPKTIGDWFSGPGDTERFIGFCKSRGLLLCDSCDKATRQLSSRGAGRALRRRHCFQRDRLADVAGADWLKGRPAKKAKA